MKTPLLLPRPSARPETAEGMRPLRGFLAAAVGALLCLLPLAAQGAAELVRYEHVAGRDIGLPGLPGFEEVLGRSAEFDRLMSKFVLPGNRMLAFYISDDDMAGMADGVGEGFRRYLIVQTVQQAVFLDGNVRFEDIKNSFREEMKHVQPQELSEVGEVMRGAAEYIGSAYDTEMRMEVGESRSQGAFAESTDYIGFLNLSSLAIETEQGKREYPAAVAMMAVNVRDRLILVYSYHSNYEDPSDLDIVQETANLYTALLLAVNAPEPVGAIFRNFMFVVLFVTGALIAGTLIYGRLRGGRQDGTV